MLSWTCLIGHHHITRRCFDRTSRIWSIATKAKETTIDKTDNNNVGDGGGGECGEKDHGDNTKEIIDLEITMLLLVMVKTINNDNDHIF